jgi:hypothetical protein
LILDRQVLLVQLDHHCVVAVDVYTKRHGRSPSEAVFDDIDSGHVRGCFYTSKARKQIGIVEFCSRPPRLSHRDSIPITIDRFQRRGSGIVSIDLSEPKEAHSSFLAFADWRLAHVSIVDDYTEDCKQKSASRTKIFEEKANVAMYIIPKCMAILRGRRNESICQVI